MRISMIGLGAVGGAFAALLDRAGHEVTAIARAATAEAIGREGLILEGARGNHTAHIAVADTVPSDAELLIVSVRSFATEAALTEHLADIGDTPVLLVQNGLDGPDVAAAALARPDARGIFAGLSLFPSTRLAPNSVRLTGLGGLRIGHAHPAEASKAAAIARIMGDAVPAVSIPNLRGALWSKLLVNHVNALPAITGTSVQAVCRHPLLRSVLADALTDAVRIADASRIRFGRTGVIEPAHVAAIRSGRALQVVTGRLATAFGYVPNPASTLQSIRRGEPTEIDDLDGAVIRAAAAVRMRAPIHEAMVDMVHRVSYAGEFMAPACILDRCYR